MKCTAIKNERLSIVKYWERLIPLGQVDVS